MSGAADMVMLSVREGGVNRGDPGHGAMRGISFWEALEVGTRHGGSSLFLLPSPKLPGGVHSDHSPATNLFKLLPTHP